MVMQSTHSQPALSASFQAQRRVRMAPMPSQAMPKPSPAYRAAEAIMVPGKCGSCASGRLERGANADTFCQANISQAAMPPPQPSPARTRSRPAMTSKILESPEGAGGWGVVAWFMAAAACPIYRVSVKEFVAKMIIHRRGNGER